MSTVSFLHTAEVHTEMFSRVMKEVAPGLDHVHQVRPELLALARSDGIDSIRRALAEAVRQAASQGDLLICTCSTLGGRAEQVVGTAGVPVIRVDRAMAETAVRADCRIVVVAALESTIEPTTLLLAECAADRDVQVHVAARFDAWPLFEAGKLAAFHADIAQHVRDSATASDVVVLAQASMAPAADLLRDAPFAVLSSPRLAVQEARRRLSG